MHQQQQPNKKYQPINSNYQNIRYSNRNTLQQKIQPAPHSMSDQQFFDQLQHYTPFCCYSGQGSPMFMTNKLWFLSLGCLIIINGLFLLVISFYSNSMSEDPASHQKPSNVLLLILTIMVVIANISYFFTQFLNPGIRNLASISEQEYNENGKIYCAMCKGYRTNRMQHCHECQVCVQDLDHHCGFFGKCIAGFQKYIFYLFLFCMCGCFFAMIFTMSSTVGI